MLTRRSFLASGTATLAVGLGGSPLMVATPARAWIGAVIAVAQVAYSIYQSSRTPRSRPDLKLQLIQESIGLLKDVHRRLGGMELALADILKALDKLPEQVRKIVRDELDAAKTAELLGACDNVIATVRQLRVDYEDVPLSRIPADRIDDLRTHLNLVKDRRATLFLRSDLSALALCAAAPVELAAEEFLERSKGAAKVTLYAYLEKFIDMERLDDPESLHSLYQASSREYPGFEGDGKTFSEGAPLGYFFSFWDLRKAGLPAGEAVPAGQTRLRKYLHSYVYSQEAEIVQDRTDAIWYRDFWRAIPGGDIFTVGHSWELCLTKLPLGDLKCPPEVERLKRITYITQIDHVVADMQLEVVENPAKPGEYFTQVADFELITVTEENSIRPDGHLAIEDWTDATSIRTEAGLLGGETHMVQIDGVREAPFVTPDAKLHGPASELLNLGKSNDDFAEAVVEYNKRVDLTRTLAAMISAVDATSADIRQQYKNWSVG